MLSPNPSLRVRALTCICVVGQPNLTLGCGYLLGQECLQVVLLSATPMRRSTTLRRRDDDMPSPPPLTLRLTLAHRQRRRGWHRDDEHDEHDAPFPLTSLVPFFCLLTTHHSSRIVHPRRDNMMMKNMIHRCRRRPSLPPSLCLSTT